MALSMVLTDAAIRKEKPGEKSYKLTDGRGLFLLVQPGGGKLWHYKYSFGGREKLMAIGPYPVVTLSLARERHLAARRLLDSGVDPMAQRKEEKEAQREQEAAKEHSFRSVSESWLEHWGADKSTQHVDATRRRLEANVLPLLGPRPVGEITPSEIVQVVRSVEARGRGDLAKRAFQNCGQIFRHAIANGVTDNNPVARLKPSDVLRPTVKKNLARIDVKELPALLRAIEVYRGTVLTRLAMKLMALTFVRTSELIGTPWAEINFEARRWDIPKERMKMPAPHIVPLSTQAIEVLEMLHTLTGKGKFLFPGEQDSSKPMSNNTILGALKRMGYKGIMTGHGFRGLASTILHEQEYPHEHIELQLAHTPRDPVSAAYNHARYLKPRAKMMQDWADYLEQTQRGGKVIPFVA